jgi:transposase
MHPSRTLSIGLHVQKESLAVADVAKEDHAAVVSLGTISPRQGDLAQLIRKMPSKSTPRVLVSAAGPCGSWLSRSLTTKGPVCGGVAPSLLPKKPGDGGTTNRRDAITLARLLRSGALTPVDVPTVDAAALRDLYRARDEAIRARKPAQCRLTALLLRPAIRSTGRATWGPAHRRWRREVVCPTPAQPRVCHASIRAVTAPTARLARLAHARPAQGQPWRLAPVGDARQALRGVPCPVAVTTGAARGALPRFAHPRPRMHALGCTPSADSTGERRRQGGRTTTGHSPARRALVAAAWASRSPATGSQPVPRRLEQVAQPSHESSWKAQLRLGTRDRPLSARGTNAHQVVVALARALSAGMWASAQEGALTPSRATIDSPAAVFPRC